MPTVIAILNSYAGLSAVAMGFVLDNKLLITAGALDGSSGLILAIIMCKAMNRSFTNVLFGAFGQVQQAAAGGEAREYKAESVEGASQVLEQANLVVIIPGYGMAVAQAQHKVRELYDQLEEARGDGEVRHPPGRRPDARPHERAPGGGGHPVHGPGRDGRDQSRHAAGGRRARGRGQRRGEPGRAQRQGQPDLRHADHRRRPGPHRVRDQAEQEPRLRGHRQRSSISRTRPGCCSGMPRTSSASW